MGLSISIDPIFTTQSYEIGARVHKPYDRSRENYTVSNKHQNKGNSSPATRATNLPKSFFVGLQTSYNVPPVSCAAGGIPLRGKFSRILPARRHAQAEP
jgi:hypothetical protein